LKKRKRTRTVTPGLEGIRTTGQLKDATPGPQSDTRAAASAAFARELAAQQAEGEAAFLRNTGPTVGIAPLPDRPVKPNRG